MRGAAGHKVFGPPNLITFDFGLSLTGGSGKSVSDIIDPKQKN